MTGSLDVLERLCGDLKRPAGGWTVGILTIIGLFAATVAAMLNFGGLKPLWSVAMLVTLALHVLWGSAGYYPLSIR